MKVKTIDVNAKEWFDKINGNSYFSGSIVVNYGMKTEKEFIMPFQYGYGDQFMQEAKARLHEHNVISGRDSQALWSYCRDNNIILRANKRENCLKKEVK
jgi:hypothetical protein